MLARIWRIKNACALLVGCKLVQPLWKTGWRILKKLKMELPYDLAIILLGIHPEKMKTLTQIDIGIPMFITALFTIAMTWKQLKHPLMDKWIKKLWSSCTMEYHSAMKSTS